MHRGHAQQLRWLLLLTMTFLGLSISVAASARPSQVSGIFLRALPAVSLALSSPDSKIKKQTPPRFLLASLAEGLQEGRMN